VQLGGNDLVAGVVCRAVENPRPSGLPLSRHRAHIVLACKERIRKSERKICQMLGVSLAAEKALRTVFESAPDELTVATRVLCSNSRSLFPCSVVRCQPAMRAQLASKRISACRAVGQMPDAAP